MLQNRLRLVLLDRLGHHVQDVVHHRGTQLQVVVRFDTLLRDSLGDTLAVSTFELTREKIAKPGKQNFRQRVDTATTTLTIVREEGQFHA
jgi:hypothetical protein